MIDVKFKEWACSFSGCDGGNIHKADIWVCGIEWGDASKDKNYYVTEFPDEIKQGAYKPKETYEWGYHTSYKYGRSFAKLYSAIKGHKVEDYKNTVEKCTGDEIFKLNLYPIAFDGTDEGLWKKNNLHTITGFKEKHLFNTWCYFNRFPFFSEQASKHKPKLIIGTGVSYLRDFFACFGGNNVSSELVDYKDITTEDKKETRRFYWVKLNEYTTLVVIPFPSGRHGLNRDELLQKIGEEIKNLIS